MQQAMRNYDQRQENTEPSTGLGSRLRPEEIKAYVTALGYLFCPGCAALNGCDTSNSDPVWERNCAHDGDECDACGDEVRAAFDVAASN